ncbi:MAG: hypothetical protein VXV96_05295 [Bdellovibrionota bacterium]|jgi:hypothetical protein|nr:hypothetical protein [Bdellovibrionota bacterium]
MADLKVPYNKLSNKEDAYKEACALITPEYIEKWKIKADISYDEANTKLQAKGKGFTLDLVFTDTQAEVNCDLSFMLKPFKKSVLETIEGKLKRHI